MVANITDKAEIKLKALKDAKKCKPLLHRKHTAITIGLNDLAA
jgi:hypothetical protein